MDSEANPETTPIILSCDVTGSMGITAEVIVKEKLGVIMNELIQRKPVTNPQIMCAATGDAECDMCPLQVPQFEADMKIDEQLEQIWLEGGGGGNRGESYALTWWFALYKCKTDAWKKRGKKGYIFTIGDECPLPLLRKEQVTKFLGVPCQFDIPIEELLKDVQEHWHVFHLIVRPVSSQPVETTWTALLGDHAVRIQDVDLLGEGIVSIIQHIEGTATEAEIAESWTDTKVREAIAPLLLTMSR